MAKKDYKIRARLVFNGQVTVQAHNRQEAEAMVAKDIAAVLGKVELMPGADEHVTDWDFSTHGEAVVKRGEEEQA